jgi:hypothetical protein
MTTQQTLKVLETAGKPLSLTHLYRLFSNIGIKPLGRSRPQQYAKDTAERILAHLGVQSHAAVYPSPQTRSSAGLISAKQLRKYKPATKAKK